MQCGALIEQPSLRPVGWAVVFAAALFTASDGRDSNDSAVVSNARQIQAIFDTCTREMLASTCSVLNDKPANMQPASSAVFVAGVGRIDPEAYRNLRELGDAMCGQVRRSCTTSWAGASCRTARSLWSKT